MESIAKLIKELTRLPGIGEKTATRLAYYIARGHKDKALGLSSAISDVARKLKFCPDCLNLTEESYCRICNDPQRNKSIICVVEEAQDVLAIEKTGSFNGIYHVLHGSISPLDGMGPDDIKAAELIDRLKKTSVKELIIATNPTTSGEATALYIAKLAKPHGIAITRIAFGIPFGGDIEYVDKSTLGRSIATRSNLNV
ncbi:MAG: recombination protein RecR [Deltaproteobacteria bacterium]|nr:recombination protein RecR [Deltaproteobacteria bacterium]MBI2974755.1 recombination protein RecR [Deltaproteobacteria bacterium]